MTVVIDGTTGIDTVQDSTITSAKIVDSTIVGGDLAQPPTVTGSVICHSATAVPAGGTTGAGYRMSSVSNLGVFFGSGVPTLSAAQGSLYLRTDGSSTSTRLYVNTNGTTGWTNVTTAT